MPRHYIIEVPREFDLMVAQDLDSNHVRRVDLDDFIRETRQGMGPEEIAGNINHYLAEHGMKPLLRTDIENWGLEEKKLLMKLQGHFEWDRGDIGSLYGEEDPYCWQTLTCEFWRLVQPRERAAR